MSKRANETASNRQILMSPFVTLHACSCQGVSRNPTRQCAVSRGKTARSAPTLRQPRAVTPRRMILWLGIRPAEGWTSPLSRHELFVQRVSRQQCHAMSLCHASTAQAPRLYMSCAMHATHLHLSTSKHNCINTDCCSSEQATSYNEVNETHLHVINKNPPRHRRHRRRPTQRCILRHCATDDHQQQAWVRHPSFFPNASLWRLTFDLFRLLLETIASSRIADRFESFESRADDRRGVAPRKTLERIQEEQQSQYVKPSRQLRHVGSLVAGMVREENAADVVGGH